MASQSLSARQTDVETTACPSGDVEQSAGGIDHEPRPVRTGRRLFVALIPLVLASLLGAGVLTLVATVPALAILLALVAWTGLLGVAIASLVYGIEAIGESL